MTMREKMARTMGPILASALSSRSPMDAEEKLIDAALDALMEPTDAMVEAGMASPAFGPRPAVLHARYACMIRAVKDGK